MSAGGGVTSLDDLNIQSMPNVYAMGQQQQPDMNTTEIQEMLSGLKSAQSTGATLLPNRDIPMDTSPYTHDVQQRPTYIPQEPKRIRDDEYLYYQQQQQQHYNNMNNMNNNNNKYNENSIVNVLLNDFKLPVILMILFFIFQLPVFKQNCQFYFPQFYDTHLNVTLAGMIILSILFGLIYMFIQKLTGEIYS